MFTNYAHLLASPSYSVQSPGGPGKGTRCPLTRCPPSTVHSPAVHCPLTRLSTTRCPPPAAVPPSWGQLSLQPGGPGGMLTTEPAHPHLPVGARPSPDPGQDPMLSRGAAAPARTAQPAQGAPWLQGRCPSTQRSGLPRGQVLPAAPQPSLPLPAEAGTQDQRAPDPRTCPTGRSGAWTRLQQGGRDG